MASTLDPSLPEIFYNAHNSFTLQYPLLLAPLEVSDSEDSIQAKLKITGTYIDILLARRIWNGRSIVYKDMDREMYSLMVEVRGKTLLDLKALLADRIAHEQCTFAGTNQFALNSRNRPKMRAILARITDYVEMAANQSSPNFENYVRGGRNRFEIEHIWADHYARHTDEFSQQHEFSEYRNRIGGLLLLPKSFNASYGDLPYAAKLDHYNSQNLLARSLHAMAYDHNPGFKSFIGSSGLAFKAHPEFKQADLDERQTLYGNLAELVWDPTRLQ